MAVDIEKLKTQATPLSEEQAEDIRKEAEAEGIKEDAIAAGEKPPEEEKKTEKEPEKPEEKAIAPEGETDEEKQARETKEAEEAEEATKAEADKAFEDASDEDKGKLITEKEKELEAEEDEEAKKAIEARLGEMKEVIMTPEQKEEANTKKLEDAFSAEVVEYAKTESVSEDEARELLLSEAKFAEKYDNDPKKIARAARNTQVMLGKTQEELKQAKAKPSPAPIPLVGLKDVIEKGEFEVGGKKISKEKFISAYRETEPDITEDMEDNKVFPLALKEMKARIEKSMTQNREVLKSEAGKKRTELISKLSEVDKKYLPDIKPLIDETPDAQIMSEQFNLADMVRWAKGGIDIEKVEKESYAKGLAKGKEEAKILGEKGPVGGTGKKKTKKEAKTGSAAEQLSETDKTRALEMFDNPVAFPTDEDKYKAFLDDKKHEESLSKK